MSEPVRSFLALEVPPGHRQRLEDEQRGLRATLPPARWVRPQGLHLTLKFLGEVEGERLGRVVAELAPLLAGLGAVRVTLAGAGFFPGPARPRVAWVGGEAAGVEPVVEAVESCCARHGFERERRRWSPHLTLARLRDPWHPPAVQRFLAWGESFALEPYVAGEVVLFGSSLEPGGAVYTALERVPLG